MANNLLLTVWQYLYSFSHSCLRKRGRKSPVKPTMKTDFSIKWRIKVIQVNHYQVSGKPHASTLTAPKIRQPKLQKKSAGSFEAPSPRNAHLYPWALYRLKAVSLDDVLSLIVWVYLLSNFNSKLRNTSFCSNVRYGRSRSSTGVDFGTSWKGMQDCQLVIVTLALSSTVSNIIIIII